MPPDDAIRWNERYRNQTNSSFESPRPFLIEVAHLLPDSGLALDVAMGLGGNASFLLARGLRVIGVDVSEVAVRRAKTRLPALDAVVADLTRTALPPDAFDVIVNFYYLDRTLWPMLRRTLKPGGLLVFETITRDMLALRPDMEPVYLLGPGELRAAFADWDVRVYREGWLTGHDEHRRATAQLAARRPA
jgi:SAM-dependent methyltransferase